MFSIGLLIGAYSLVIFSLGLLGMLNRSSVLLITLAYILCAVFSFRNKLSESLKLNINSAKSLDKVSIFLIILIVFQAAVNLIGVAGPEIGFDALWYHLTLPKLYLENHGIFHVPGGLLYYSDIPKLTEMLYVSSISLYNENLAKLIHFIFGLLVVSSTYKFSRKLMNKQFSLLAGLIFYTSLVVGWESISAYVDLSRTFFELLAFWAFYEWIETKQKRKFILSGLMLGFAISVKLTALGSLIIFIAILVLLYKKLKLNIKILSKYIISLFIISLLVSLPWFVFSYLNTGNPVFPFLSINIASGNFISLPNILNIFSDLYKTFLNLSDPISPIYAIGIPIIIVTLRKFEKKAIVLVIYPLVGFLVWYLLLMKNGGRFLLPYLPVFSILIAYSFYLLKNKFLKFSIISIAVIVAFSSIGYRFLANSKYIEVVLGQETKSEFLSKNLNFSFGDFYDTDDYFKKTIKKTDKVLLFGFHNLYYVEFPFIDSSWVKKGDKFNYIALQNSNLPSRFSKWELIYQNNVTNVKLYSLSNKIWEY